MQPPLKRRRSSFVREHLLTGIPELRGIATIALRHDLFVLTDEIYEYFVYDGRRHISPGLDGRRKTGDGRGGRASL